MHLEVYFLFSGADYIILTQKRILSDKGNLSITIRGCGIKLRQSGDNTNSKTE